LLGGRHRRRAHWRGNLHLHSHRPSRRALESQTASTSISARLLCSRRNSTSRPSHLR
jgi:hypothetical protein